MANTLKASPQGLAIVDRSRRRKGWTKTRTPAWWNDAYTTQATLKRFWRGIAIQRDNFIAICRAVGIEDWEAIVETEVFEASDSAELETSSPPEKRIDWGEAPEIPTFYGRALELRKLEHWIVRDRCKLITLLGMGGIGKTALAVKLVAQIEQDFDGVIWRSLLPAPPLLTLLDRLIQFCSRGRETLKTDNPQQGITQAISHLQQRRYLIVLDEAETILRSHSGQPLRRGEQYREGYEDYGEFFKRLGSDRHQSCIAIVSREKPGEIVAYEGQMLPVRSLHLSGLQPEDALHLCRTQGFSCSDNELKMLTNFYSGNPLALKVIATLIQEVFNGDVASFLNQNTLVLGDRLRELVGQQVERLSELETEVLYWLALVPEPLSLSQLSANLLFPPTQSQLLEVLAALERRSLIEKMTGETEAYYMLQPLVMKYAMEKSIEQALDEIETVLEERDIEAFKVLKNHAFHPLTSSKSSEFHLLERLKKGLQMRLRCDERQIEKKLSTLAPLLQDRSPRAIGYVRSNLQAIFKH
ncbi:NB-ARC domain-containing protein [Lusitaniella coriacea]|uniref:NB-ARC domain-containing protein n=1 Tax=Lusitaniella coriacea TaxID=1983105 RepID=UPI003CEF135A